MEAPCEASRGYELSGNADVKYMVTIKQFKAFQLSGARGVNSSIAVEVNANVGDERVRGPRRD
jgi:hypothetical protein